MFTPAAIQLPIHGRKTKYTRHTGIYQTMPKSNAWARKEFLIQVLAKCEGVFGFLMC